MISTFILALSLAAPAEKEAIPITASVATDAKAQEEIDAKDDLKPAASHYWGGGWGGHLGGHYGGYPYWGSSWGWPSYGYGGYGHGYGGYGHGYGYGYGWPYGYYGHHGGYWW